MVTHLDDTSSFIYFVVAFKDMFTGKCAFLKLAKSPKYRFLRITFVQFIGSTSYLEKILYIALHYDRGT